jgi:hypothetical protein
MDLATGPALTLSSLPVKTHSASPHPEDFLVASPGCRPGKGKGLATCPSVPVATVRTQRRAIAKLQATELISLIERLPGKKGGDEYTINKQPFTGLGNILRNHVPDGANHKHYRR